jgi:hypothetical protein
MSTKVIRRLTPEEEELARKRAELGHLENELAERELYLTTLRAEISVFQSRYLRRVGVLYAELDEWNAKVVELKAKAEGTPEAEARTQAEESSSAVHGEDAAAKEFTPSAELKSLYREVAKRVHPDLAVDQADRDKRERLMAEANLAYQRGDSDTLKRILEEYESSPESVHGTGTAADLVRVIRQMSQLRRRLIQVEEEITSLNSSDIAKLKVRAEEADAKGRDLLAEMARDVQDRVDTARRRYENSSAGLEKP